MKICVLNVLHGPFDKRVFHKIIKSLVEAGHEVTSVAPSQEALAETDRVLFETVPVATGLPARFVSTFRVAWEGRKVKADVYVGVEPESWVSALLIKAMKGGKVVFDVHEPIPPEFAKFFPRPFQPFMEWLTVKAMRVFARFTDHIILTRASLDAEFKGLKVPRTVVINTNHLQPPCNGIPEALRVKYAERPTVIHQGIFGEIRGSYQLLEAMRIVAREIPEVKCILLGDYVYGDENEYKEAISKAGLDDVFDILGVVPFHEVPAYIAVSRAGLILLQPSLPGHALAMPHKLFDYMRESVAVIAPTFTQEVARIVEEADCGVLVEVTDPVAIADGILRLLSDPAASLAMGQRGRQLVETKYNWQRDEAKLLSAFSALEQSDAAKRTG